MLIPLFIGTIGSAAAAASMDGNILHHIESGVPQRRADARPPATFAGAVGWFQQWAYLDLAAQTRLSARTPDTENTAANQKGDVCQQMIDQKTRAEWD